MKIVEVETFVVANPPPRHGGRYFIFVKLTTDNGVSGIGEAYAASFNPHLIAKMIEDTADRFLIGENPFQIDLQTRPLVPLHAHSDRNLRFGAAVVK